ncbi:hypothetical protein BDV23DRAFT_165773 [Aspergillus alliaceus]|uniref:Uncharacterized protein n=1 Tax=Petromyces alliaceus TaxID=209559 RepID=A0A5N7BT39_PETAA|nr:hypothetical protein BDV23DRAFT_165773 [Aspergillus alliaceus]
MAPRQRVVSAHQEKSFFSAAYDEVTHPENATIVRSVLVFGVSPYLFNSSVYSICQGDDSDCSPITGRCRFPLQLPKRTSPPSVSRHISFILSQYP